MHSQSAMEYLMTYGWSILIVAVVLGTLAYLGVFNPLYFAPKANPGSCQVFRSNGVGTSYDINLLGTCSGEIPEYVALFNGQNSYILVPHSASDDISSAGKFTALAWIREVSFQQNGGIIDDGGEYCCDYTSGFGFVVGSTGTRLNLYVNSLVIGTNPPTTNMWMMVVGEYDAATGSSAIYEFYNGKAYATPGSLHAGLSLQQQRGYDIGGMFGNGDASFNGVIANVQLYNATLDSVSINALYLEGIGGTPIDLQNLVGWWPLNGNANDYSGNGNNGDAINVNYTNSWISSYNPQ